MRKVEIELFGFDELSETAKKKVLNDFSEINIATGWWQQLAEEAREIGISIFSKDDINFEINKYVDVSISEVAQSIIRFIDENEFLYNYATEYLHNSEGQDELFIRGVERFYYRECNSMRKYLATDEAIIQTIKGMDFEFTEKGVCYHDL